MNQNSQLLARHLPNAELRIYPDARTASSTNTQGSSATTSGLFSTPKRPAQPARHKSTQPMPLDARE